MGDQVQAQPQLPSWWDYAKQLPPDIPDEAYDAQRNVFFHQNIAPHVLMQGGNLEGTWQAFKHLTERPDKNPVPRLSHFATTAAASALEPITRTIETLAGDKEEQLTRPLEEMKAETAEELHRQGMGTTLPTMAGEAAGMAPYFSGPLGLASKASKALEAGRGATALMEGLAGGVTQGAYDAAKAQDGHRIEDGLMGGVQGGAMFTAFGLLHGLLRTHPDMPKSMAKDVIQNAKTVVNPPAVASAEAAESAFPGVPQTVADTVQEQVKAANRNGVPVQPTQLEGNTNGYVKIQIKGADGKTYNIGGKGGVNVGESDTFNRVVNRITQHLENGGQIIQEKGDLTALQSLHKTLERMNGVRGEYDTPVTLKGAEPASTEPTLLQTPEDLLPKPPKAGSQTPAAQPLEGVEPGVTPEVPPSGLQEDPVAGERIGMLKDILTDPNAARVMKLHAKQELFRISPSTLDEVMKDAPMAELEVPHGWTNEQWREYLKQEATEEAPELASRGLTIDDVPEYDKLEQLSTGQVQDLSTGRTYPNKEAALREKGLLRYSVGDPSKKVIGKPLQSAWWIDPTGKAVPVKVSHEADAMEIQKVTDRSALGKARAYKQMFDDGWTRVVGNTIDTKTLSGPSFDKAVEQAIKYAKGESPKSPYHLDFVAIDAPTGFAQIPLADIESGESIPSLIHQYKGAYRYSVGDPTKPEASTPTAVPSEPSQPDVVRGSTEIPLSPSGEAQVAERGRQFATRGGVDSILSSSKGRAIQSAQAVQQANPSAQFEPPTDDLKPWMLGSLEGRDVREVLDEMNDYISNRPDEVVPGMGAQSTEPGESFNSFKDRTLSRVRQEMDAFEQNPDQKRLLVTHYRNLKAIQSWLKNGMPDDLSIDNEEMLRQDGKPGDVYKMIPDESGQWTMEKTDMEQQDPLDSGIYIMRHGNTSWNGENAPLSSEPAPGSYGDEKGIMNLRPSRIAAVGEPPKGWGEMPEEAHGATMPTEPGQKPVYWFRSVIPQNVTHEWVHGMMNYFGIRDQMVKILSDDPSTGDFGKLFGEIAKVYKPQDYAEESYAYLAQAVRHDNNDLIRAFAEKDTDEETVFNWVENHTKAFQEALASEPESVMKRVSQRRLGEILRRSTGRLDDLSRDNIAIHGGDIYYDEGQWHVEHPDGSIAHFVTRGDALEYAESLYSEPLSSRNLVDTSALPDGVPRYALDTKPFTTERAPIGTNPPPPWNRFPKIDKEGKLPEGGQVKSSLDIVGGWFRPFYPWINGVSERNQWPELATRATAVKDAEQGMHGAIQPFVDPLSKMMNTFDLARQRDVYKFFSAATDEARTDVYKNAHFTPEEISAINDFERDFIDPSREALGVDLRDYMRKWAPKYAKLGDDLDSLRPRYSDTIKSPFQFMEGAIRKGELDPRDQNMARVSAAYLHAGFRKQYMEEPLNAFAELNNLKTEDGRYVTGNLQPLIKRHIEYMRGVPDYTQEIIDNVVSKFKDLYNTGVDIANQHLPERFKLDPLEDPPRAILGKWILYQYAGGLALRPMVPIRDALQLFITTLPVLGEKYMWRGMEAVFGKEGALRAGTEGDMYQGALKAGALLRRNDLYRALSGEDSSQLGKWSQGAMQVIQHSHNSNRLVAYWGHYYKTVDAAAAAGDDVAAFSKEAGLHWLDAPVRQKFLDEYTSRVATGEKGLTEEMTQKIAKEMVDVSQWNYSKGAQPGIHKYALGRLFGQYGIYPLNYIEFARRLATSGELGDKALALTRLTLAHGAILKAGEAVGIDTAPWVFTQPMAYGGGPLFQAVQNVPGTMDFQTKKGSDARAAVIRPIWPMSAPGGLEAYDLYKAIVEDKPGKWQTIMGFHPLRGADEEKGWHGIL